MNKDSEQLIDNLKSDQSTLNELDNIARRYHNQSIPHNLDKNVLFQIELLHEKIGTILVHLYMGDLEKKCFQGEITKEEYTKIIRSTFADYQYMSSSFLYNEQYIKDFSVKGKKFVFNLDKGSCYRIANGVCSLDVNKKELDDIVRKEFNETEWFSKDYEEFIKYAQGREDSVLYCRSLEESISKNGFKSPCLVNHYKCNHYSFIDGQHRACLSSKINIPLLANVSDMTSEDYSCPICENKIKEKNAIEFRQRLAETRLNRKPLQKLLVKLKIKEYQDYSPNIPNHSYESQFLKQL